MSLASCACLDLPAVACLVVTSRLWPWAILAQNRNNVSFCVACPLDWFPFAVDAELEKAAVEPAEYISRLGTAC